MGRREKLQRLSAIIRLTKPRIFTRPFCLTLLASVAAALSLRAESDEPSNAYRLSLFTYHKVTDDLTGLGYLGLTEKPDEHSQMYYIGWPAANYSVNSWLQVWGGLFTYYTDNRGSSDTLELRPFIGPKLFIPNTWKWSIFNYTRYEYRSTMTLDTDQWTGVSRIRSRFGVEIPFATRERAWKAKTWYGLVDVEPFYRFDHNQIDPVRVRGGVGYVLNKRVQLEFIYTAEFARSGGALEYDQNTFRLNIRIAMTEGIARRLLGWSARPD